MLGALVLGHSIKRSGSKHARVCLYADDVPAACVALLAKIWDCRPVQHIDVAAHKLGNSIPGHRFAKVFTKLRALELVEFEKILVMDIDIFVCLTQLPFPRLVTSRVQVESTPFCHAGGVEMSTSCFSFKRLQRCGVEYTTGRGSRQAGDMMRRVCPRILVRPCDC